MPASASPRRRPGPPPLDGRHRALSPEAVILGVERRVLVEIGDARVRVARGFNRGVLEAVVAVLTAHAGGDA